MQIDGVLARELRRHYLFCALSDEQRERLLAASRTRRFVAGEVLFRRGDGARHFSLLRSGCVKLYRLSPEGGEKIMRLIRAGQTFAESTLFMEIPTFPVHGEGVEDGELVEVDRDAFLGILKESFATCQAVMAQMTARIQAHWDEIETLAPQNSRYRIVHYLLGLAPATAQGRAAVTLPTRKMVIAAHQALSSAFLRIAIRDPSGLDTRQGTRAGLRGD